MDETYPRKKEAKKALAKEKYIKSPSEEKLPKSPDSSFTLASSHMMNPSGMLFLQ
jgi:hypothetical protein